MAMWLSPLAIFNAVAAIGPYAATRDIAYADGPRHRLDVYAPAGNGGSRPVVVFFYGGGWEQGERADYRFVGSALAGRGIIAVIPDYRIYPDVRFPAFLEDAALAVRWARDHAAAFGGDPDRIVLAGHSAGAHIAAMLAFDRQWLAAVGLDPARDLKGVVGLAGPYDFLPVHSRTLAEIFGPEPDRWRSQPINFVGRNGPPAFLATGRADDTVDPGNTTRLAERIREKGGAVQVKIYDRVGHPTILGALAWPLRPLAPVLDDMVAFVHQLSPEGAIP